MLTNPDGAQVRRIFSPESALEPGNKVAALPVTNREDGDADHVFTGDLDGTAEAVRAARFYNQFAHPTEYAVVVEPTASEPVYRLRVTAFQLPDYECE